MPLSSLANIAECDNCLQGLTTLQGQPDPTTGELQSDVSTKPLLQIAPDIYWLSYVFSGAQCGVVSFNSSCLDSLTWFVAGTASLALIGHQSSLCPRQCACSVT